MALLTSTAGWQCHCHNIISLSPVCPTLEGLIHLVVWFGAVGLAAHGGNSGVLVDRPAANLLTIFSCEHVEVVAFGGGGGGGGRYILANGHSMSLMCTVVWYNYMVVISCCLFFFFFGRGILENGHICVYCIWYKHVSQN